jgi:integrase
MSRKSKGPHLLYRQERLYPNGTLKERGAWFIIDESRRVPTGFAEDQAGDAQVALANYVTERYRPPRREQDIESLIVANVLMVYNEDLGPKQANQRVYLGSLSRLNEWWGAKVLSEITGDSCRAYVKCRKTPGGARRDLELLRAAVNHHAKEGLHRGVVRVWLPEKGKPRERWLTRSEAAALLWYCWRKREMMTITRGPNKGTTFPTKRRPLRHIARFILLGLYTGTRAEAIASASPQKLEGRSWIDLDNGVFYRLQEGRKATNKRQPAVKIPPHLLGFLRRWARPDEEGKLPQFFIEWNGKPITTSVKTGFASAIAGARVEGKPIEHATPHTLRHTAATWLMQNGAETWEAAGFLGMSEQILRNVYGHHHPDFQRKVATHFRPRKTT